MQAMRFAGWRVHPSAIVCALMMGVMVLSLPCHAATTVVIHCDDSYPPYSFQSAGQPEGIYIDILRAVDERLSDYRIEIVPTPWRRGLTYIETGDGFGLIPPYWRDERLPWGDYSTPILDEFVVAVGRPGESVTSGKWPEGAFGRKVGINSGFNIGGDAFNEAGRQGKLVIEHARSNAMNMMKLFSGRIDFYVNDRNAILWETRAMIASGQLPAGTGFPEYFQIQQESGHLLLTRTGRYPYKEDFLRQFNSVIAELQSSGTIQQIVDTFIEKRPAH